MLHKHNSFIKTMVVGYVTSKVGYRSSFCRNKLNLNRLDQRETKNVHASVMQISTQQILRLFILFIIQILIA